MSPKVKQPTFVYFCIVESHTKHFHAHCCYEGVTDKLTRHILMNLRGGSGFAKVMPS